MSPKVQGGPYGVGKVGVLCSRIRIEEKLIFEALRKRGVEFEKFDVRNLYFSLHGQRSREVPILGCEAVLIRCISHQKALYASKVLESLRVKTVNPFSVIRTAGDKAFTTLALLEQGVPTLPAAIPLTPGAALKAIEGLGYPAVLKPVRGSWGRLLAKVENPLMAESILEHRSFMGDPFNSAFYLQRYVEKPGRDIRALVIGEEVVYAIYRYSSHWITNTAQGSRPEVCPITPELEGLALKAAQAVGGGILAVDIFETPQGSDSDSPALLVNEVNHTPEFHGAMQVVEVDIAGKIVDYLLQSCSS